MLDIVFGWEFYKTQTKESNIFSCVNIEDPSESVGRQYGILEIKCPYSARRMTPETACHEINRFCCTLIDGHTILKKPTTITIKFKVN